MVEAMKKSISVLGIAVLVIIGGLSMGCIDTTPVVIEEPVEQPEEVEVVEVIEILPVVEVIEILPVVEVVKEQPYLTYKRVYVAYPENLVGFDTIEERAYIYQGMLNERMEAIDTLTVSQYISPSAYPVEEFYTGYYQGMLDEYTEMYIMVGNKVMVDEPLAEGWNFSIEEGNSTGNSSA